MRWRAKLVPLAAVTAATLLLSASAWAQAPAEEETPTSAPAEESPPIEEVEDQATDPEGQVAEEEVPAEPQPEPSVETEVTPAPKASASKVSKKAKPMGGPLPVLPPTNVDLHASPKVIRVGAPVKLWGRLNPNGEKRWIRIFDLRSDRKLKSVRTNENGRFEVKVSPRMNVLLEARWSSLKSERRRVSAIPRLNVKMDPAYLFGKTKVKGSVNPIAAGKTVKLTLRKLDKGKVMAQKTVRSRKDGSFKAKFRINFPGTYRTTATFEHKDWLRAKSRTGAKGTPLPTLSAGSSGGLVKLLEKRLVQLRHHLSGKNTYFGQDTSDAVMAFNKVHGRSRVSYVTSDTWRALANARRPKARFKGPKFHIEVNQTKQVLYVVRRGKVKKILHVSTGKASTPTYNGTFEFWGKLAGYSPNRLDYPSYFHGARAIHGWPSVPNYPASHGCVRIPMWAAKWMFAKIDVGDTIKVYR